MIFDELWDDYLKYLIWRCRLEKYVKYGTLFKTLHNIDFYYIIDRDDNRDEDGYDLRNDYKIPKEFVSMREEFYSRKTSVFEMLIALSIRVNDEIIGDPSDEHPEYFFIEMLDNLFGSLKRNNHLNDQNYIIDIVNKWLNRDFRDDGFGSPFPVTHDLRDQTKLEIWDQMMSYINENFE